MARKKAETYDLKRNQILRVAVKMFASDGYDRTSMSSLAAACGMSKALVYHYYKNKDALLYDVIRTHIETLCEKIENADKPDSDPVERVNILCCTLLEAYQDADDDHRVQINALKFLDKERQEHIKELERKLVVIFADAMKGLNPNLADNKELLKPVTMSLFGMLNWHYMWFRPDGAISRKEYARIATKIIVEGARSL